MSNLTAPLGNRSGQLPAPAFQSLFEAAPGACLVLLTDDPAFTIVAVNDAYLRVTGTTREQIVGHKLFAAFPDNPEDSAANGVLNLAASLRRAIASRAPDKMATQKYDIQWQETGGVFKERYWNVVNVPVAGESGRIEYLIHWVEDVTEKVRLEHAEQEQAQQAELHRRRSEQAGEALAEANRRRDEVLESITDGFFGLDRQWHFIYVNLAAEQLIGIPRRELLGKYYWDVFAPAMGTVIEHEYRRAVRDQVPVEFETFYEPWQRWFAVKGYPTQQGGLSVYFRDITERKRAEAALQESENRFRKAFAHAPIGMALTTLEGQLVETNQAYCDLLGYSHEELAQSDLYAITHPDDVPRSRKLFAALLRDEVQSYVIEKRYLRKDGQAVWVRATVSVYGSMGGQPAQVIRVVENIDERKKADEELHRQWRTFDTALSYTPDLIYNFDTHGRFTYANRALLAVWQRTLEEIVGKSPHELHYTPELASKLMQQVQQVIATRQTLRDETAYTGPSGQTREYDYFFVPVFGTDGQVEAVAGSTRDITERKQAEVLLQQQAAALQAANDELTRASRELEQFAYVASHDLQEPLRMVKIFTQLFLQQYAAQSDDTAREFAGYVQTGVTRMEGLIRDLLAYSRSVHPEQREASPTDLNASLQQALTVLSVRVGETAAEITQDELPTVMADEGQLALVFQNLLSNALKYHREGTPPRIHVGAEEHDPHWVVRVADNGIGFAPQYAERIFGLFKRLHRDEYPGTGLGLAICQRIVERYGGRMWAESEPGAGSTFFVALPKVKSL